MSDVVEVVRHAAALPRQEWRENDVQRPLDDRGRAQAAALADALVDLTPAVVTLVASPTLRGVQTLSPLGQRLGLDVVTDAALAEVAVVPTTDAGDAWVAAAWKGGRTLGLLDRLRAEHPAGRIVMCGHGEVIPALLALLAGRDDLSVPDVRCGRAGRFTLTFDGRRCRSVVAVPAPGSRHRRQDR